MAESVVGRVVRNIGIAALALSVVSCSSAIARPSVTPAVTPAASGASASDPVIAAAGDIACAPTANKGAPANCLHFLHRKLRRIFAGVW